MRTFVIVSCLVAVVVAQFPPAVPGVGSTHSQHFQALNQPHLPKDSNVLHATQQFLDKFAQLKALSDAAPDPVQQGRQPQQNFNRAPQQNFNAAPHRFAAPQQQAAAPRPVPAHPASSKFDVNSEIKTLLDRHHAANPTPAPAPRRAPVQQFQAQQHRAPVQQHRAPVQQQRAPAFPTFNTFQQQQPQPQRQAPRFSQASVQPVDPNVVTHNKQGQLINPERFPGPLAHTVPAGVSGRVMHTQFTPEVAQAHRALASAHASILQQQAALPRPQF